MSEQITATQTRSGWIGQFVPHVECAGNLSDSCWSARHNAVRLTDAGKTGLNADAFDVV